MKLGVFFAAALLALSAGAASAVTTDEGTITFEAASHALTIEAEVSSLTDDDFAPSVVPLPAAGWMLLAGLGGLVAMRRRAKA